MSNINRTSRPFSGRTGKLAGGAVIPILLLAPLALAAKGCDAVVGNDCPSGYTCTSDNAGGAGIETAGSDNAGAPGAGNGNAGAPGAGSGNAGAPGAGSGNAGAPGAGGSSGALVCGGLRGLRCAKDEYCLFPAETQCGASDQTGTCKVRPTVCDQLYAPVCGCDGQTYSNVCVAASAGTSVGKSGACASDPGKTCGGLKGLGCAKGEFCEFAADAKCGAADQTGTCTQVPELCPDIYLPVCGCDGKTYPNPCNAEAASVSVTSEGACATSPVECGGLLGKTCPQGQFCNFPPDSKCGNADMIGSCQVPPTICSAVSSPVCGCDGKTYDSPCLAASARTSVLASGKCQ